jgi:hypothetical protein
MPPVITKPTVEWKDERIQIVMEDGIARRKVDAKVYGSVAVHRRVSESVLYSVTSLTTGLELTRAATEEDALKIGEEAWNRACMVLREKTEAGIKSRMPKWLPKWCGACRLKARYLDPRPFILEYKNE